MSVEEKYTVEFTEDGCAILRMKNGQNRLNVMTLMAINKALDKVEQNSSCRVLITTGEGKFYSNGLDLDWLKANPERVPEFNVLLIDSMWRLMHFPLPTVAAINGHSFAGGGFLAICHDYRVMRSDRGWISWNETLINLRIRGPMQEILHLKLDSRAIRESVVYAKRITGPEAVSLGIVDSVTSADRLISEAKSLGFGALGKNNIDRDMLKTMKQDTFPRKEFGVEIPSKM
ncbi:hypothetical protein FSP39_024400 [Pinctada imbricata]|uniref:Uncharacterized protein n=1 Tax=Pinctada imbricata TaxID=66713 RepID=A0AA89BLD5_PINIB|nr:hypothetical protein FSP39_024400 [Pinctada imbricata]